MADGIGGAAPSTTLLLVVQVVRASISRSAVASTRLWALIPARGCAVVTNRTKMADGTEMTKSMDEEELPPKTDGISEAEVCF